MTKLLVLCVVFFTCFPFLRLLPLDTYNQPYAFLLSSFLIVLNVSLLKKIPTIDFLSLFVLATIGFFQVIFLVLQSGLIEFRELLYLLSYISPLFIVPCIYHAMKVAPDECRNIISFAVVMWLFVGLVQLFVDPGFLNFMVSKKIDLGSRLIDSGRGVLSLAPETTHHGLQMLLLSASLAIVGGNKFLVLAALLGVGLLSRSSFSVFLVLASIGFWILLSMSKKSFIKIVILLLLIGIMSYLPIFPESSRISIIFSRVSELGLSSLTLDQSGNMRIYGMVMPIYYSLSNFLWPSGFSLEAWMNTRILLLTEFRDIIDLSRNGPASGFGLLIYQCGFMALPVMWVIWKRFFGNLKNSGIYGVLYLASFGVFWGQMYLATPSFSLIYGLIIWRYHNYKLTVSK